MKFVVLIVSVLFGLAAAKPIGEQEYLATSLGYMILKDDKGKLSKANTDDTCTVPVNSAAETNGCSSTASCELVARHDISAVTINAATCGLKRVVYTGSNREKADVAYCPDDGCPAWFGMAHVKLNSKATGSTQSGQLFEETTTNFAAENALKVICPLRCKEGSGTTATFKRCVKSSFDCKQGYAAIATQVKQTVTGVHLMSLKDANTADALNITSCPECTGATCIDSKLHSGDKAKCKDNTECPLACMYYKWIHCKDTLFASDKTEKDVGSCVDAEMKKIGCKHATADDKCMPAAAGGASTAGGIAGALMAVAVALLH